MDYTNQILTSASAEASFAAIAKHIDKWWGKTDGTVSGIGDEFSIYFADTEWRFRITKYSPFEKIYWHCVKARHIHGEIADIEKEWLGTDLEWSIIQTGSKTKIHFLHKGLTHELNCYDVCKKGWDYYISSSLKDFLDTGTGHPFGG